SRIGLLALDKHHAILRQACQRILEIERIDVVQRNELDMLQLRMKSNVIFGDREVIRGGKAFLFGSVLRISLNVHSEYFACDRRDDLVGRYRTIASD